MLATAAHCGHEVIRDAYGGIVKTMADVTCGGKELPMTGSDLVIPFLLVAVVLVALGFLVRRLTRAT